MPARLLSFLSDLENSLMADDPSPKEGTWENSRTVNYGLNIARLALNTRSDPKAPPQPYGSILLQAFEIADSSSSCLKANLAWAGKDMNAEVVYKLFGKSGTNWAGEARQIAAIWLAGPPAKTTASDSVENFAAAV